MTKATKTEKPAVVAETTQPVATKPQILQVKTGIKSRGARQAWYELACRYDGKPVADMLADGKANPPSHYTARSKHAGDAHSAEGYLRGLVRRGWVTLV